MASSASYAYTLLFAVDADRKSTRLNSSHTEIYTLSLHDALPIYIRGRNRCPQIHRPIRRCADGVVRVVCIHIIIRCRRRSEEHTSELQSHRDLHSFPTRRSSDLHPWPEPLSPDSQTNKAMCGWRRPRRMHTHYYSLST